MLCNKHIKFYRTHSKTIVLSKKGEMLVQKNIHNLLRITVIITGFPMARLIISISDFVVSSGGNSVKRSS